MLDDAAAVLLLLFCLAAAGGSGVAGDSSDAAALLAFKSAADPGNRLAFPAAPSNDSASHCRWPGVSCSPAGRVVRLVLGSSGIAGFFGHGTLDRLDQLRILSLQDNSLAGPIPDLSPLLNLRAIFLGHNSFGGRFPPSILSLHRLRVLDLSGNHLAGPVPPALASLDRLVALRLDSNRFDGSLPAFDQSSLETLNVSFNNFSGEIPITAVLSSFAASCFAANPALCGKILRKECGGDAHKLFSNSHNGTSPAEANLWQNSRFNLPASSPSQKMYKRAVVAVAFLAIVVVAAAAAALGFLRVRGFGGGGEPKAMSSLSRELMFLELKKLIEANPLFRNKLQFPNLKNSNQSLNWQHQLCKNPWSNPDIKTLSVDHSCGQPNGALAPSQANNPPLEAMPKVGSFPPLDAHGPFQPAPTPVLTPLSSWMSCPAPPMAMAAGMNGEGRNMVDVEPRIADESTEKSKIQKLTVVNEPAQCPSLRLSLPDNFGTSKISRLIYTHSGNAILALASNAIHLLWKWPSNERHSKGKATTSVAPQLWQSPNGVLMINEITDTNPEETVHCFALSKNDSYVISASGGTISLFNAIKFKTMATFMSPPPAATFIAFYPHDNNIIAIGMEDSTILIYNVRVDEVKSKLRGHSERITGLAFSNVLNVLVSSGADAQICVFETDGWEKQRSRFLQIPSGPTPASISDTHVQFHQDQTHFLAVHETLIALYETTKLECVKQWSPCEGSAPISHATFSCDSQSIYASFLDATIGILNAADLTLHCRILPSAYIVGNASATVYPLGVAAHPSEPNQFAIGMTDGGVYVLELRESDGKTESVGE